MCLMHEAKPYGHLLVNGKSVTDAQLAIQTGIPQDQITKLLGELDNAGVFSRNSDGVIYSRKMTRSAKRAAINKKNGKSGGNPVLVNRADKPPDKPPLPLEARGYIPDKPKKEDVQKIISSSVQSVHSAKPWTAEQKKAAWQSKICNEAQRRLPAEKYADFLEAWANGDPKAKAYVEQLDREMRISV